jgi:hypothetical protein
MMELATIVTSTRNDLFSNPEYKDSLPKPFAEAGMTKEAWTKFLESANDSVKFQWGIDTICCFLCNAHNKKVAVNMQKFCQDDCGDNDLLPAGVQVLYKMDTEKISISHSDGSGKGGSMQSYHKLIFVKY